jgi:hypothetical protein
MNDKFKSILSSLPEKPPRSRLAPYYALIEELRRRGCTYREIERILIDQCQFEISRSAINNFMRAQARRKAKLSKRRTVENVGHNIEIQGGIAERTIKTEVVNHEDQPSDEVMQRIAALKMRPTTAQTSSKLFHYDSSEPLRIERNAGKGNPDE